MHVHPAEMLSEQMPLERCGKEQASSRPSAGNDSRIFSTEEIPNLSARLNIGDHIML